MVGLILSGHPLPPAYPSITGSISLLRNLLQVTFCSQLRRAEGLGCGTGAGRSLKWCKGLGFDAPDPDVQRTEARLLMWERRHLTATTVNGSAFHEHLRRSAMCYLIRCTHFNLVIFFPFLLKWDFPRGHKHVLLQRDSFSLPNSLKDTQLSVRHSLRTHHFHLLSFFHAFFFTKSSRNESMTFKMLWQPQTDVLLFFLLLKFLWDSPINSLFIHVNTYHRCLMETFPDTFINLFVCLSKTRDWRHAATLAVSRRPPNGRRFESIQKPETFLYIENHTHT